MLEFSEVFKNSTLIHAVLKNVDRYGKVFGFYIGSQPYVVVADYEFVKDALKLLSGFNETHISQPLTKPTHFSNILGNKKSFIFLIISLGARCIGR